LHLPSRGSNLRPRLAENWTKFSHDWSFIRTF
jgi:hypothetical protein